MGASTLDFTGAFCLEVLFFIHNYLTIILAMMVGVALIFQLVLYYTVRSQGYFSFEIEKRVQRYIDGKAQGVEAGEFHKTLEGILSLTYKEVYYMRALCHRRSFDRVLSFLDKIFLIERSSLRLSLNAVSYVQKRHLDSIPDFQRLSQHLYATTPELNQVAWIFNRNVIIGLLHGLPLFYIVSGFIGSAFEFSHAVLQLQRIDLAQQEMNVKILTSFYREILVFGYPLLLGSIAGFVLFFANSLLCTDAKVVESINRFALNLERLWSLEKKGTPLKLTA